MNLALIIGVILIAGGNYFFTGWFVKYARLRRITDIPTVRSSHSIPTPRGGGVGFVVSSILAFLFYFIFMGLLGSPIYIAMLATTILIAGLGWLDDRMNLSRQIRFVIQLAAAISVILFIGNLNTFFIPFLSEISLGVFGAFLSLLWITGVTNIYNFMDGVDGIASVQALSAATGWMIFANLWHEPVLFAINLFVFATVASFLVHNWSPAKIFMGDVGSVFLGFFFAIMPFVAAAVSPEHSISTTIWVGGLLLWPFLFDGSFTIIRRMLNRENVFEAHRTHLYQRLNISGWSHSRISLLYFIFSFVCVVLSLFFVYENDTIRVFIIFILLVLSLIYVYAVGRMERTQ